MTTHMLLLFGATAAASLTLWTFRIARAGRAESLFTFWWQVCTSINLPPAVNSTLRTFPRY